MSGRVLFYAIEQHAAFRRHPRGFAILYMSDATKYDGKKHIATDPLNLTIGDKLEGEMFASVE
jgi:hypothetical protein